MFKRRGFKYFLMGFGMLALFAAGYAATSVVTSRTADAQVCMNYTCISPADGISSALGTVFITTIAADLVIAPFYLALYYGEALAMFGVKVLQRIGKVTRHWDAWWDNFWNYDMGPAFKDLTRQLAAMNADQARTLGSFADILTRNFHASFKLNLQGKSFHQFKPGLSVCVAGTLMGGMVKATSLGRAYSAAAPVEDGQRSSRAAGTPAAAGTAADAHASFLDYCAHYADPKENNGFTGCPNLTTAAPDALLDTDVTGQVFSNDTIDLTNPDVQRRQKRIVDILAQGPTPDPQPPAAANSMAGQGAVLQDQSELTKYNIVRLNLYAPIALRAPGSGQAGAVSDINADAGLDDPSRNSANPSAYALMMSKTNNRYRSGKYTVGQIDEPENNAREAAIQAGIRTRQLSDMLDLMDRYALVVAGQVANQVRDQASFNDMQRMTPR